MNHRIINLSQQHCENHLSSYWHRLLQLICSANACICCCGRFGRISIKQITPNWRIYHAYPLSNTKMNTKLILCCWLLLLLLELEYNLTHKINSDPNSVQNALDCVVALTTFGLKIFRSPGKYLCRILHRFSTISRL